MDTCAIASMAMNMKSACLQQAVTVGVMKMQMDSTKEAAQALVDMMKTGNQAMEKSVNPHLGSMLDIIA